MRERERNCVCVCVLCLCLWIMPFLQWPPPLSLHFSLAKLPLLLLLREREEESTRNDTRQRVCPGTIIITTAFDMTGDGDGMGNRGSNSTCPGWTLSRVPSACRFPFHTFLGS